MEIERALIIKKVWLDKIFNEGKVWEMRSSRTYIRGRIGLIESGTGLIIGEADLIDSHSISRHPSLIKYHKVEDVELLRKWRYAWVLKNAKRYGKPIPYKHPQGAVIWVKLPIKTTAKMPCGISGNCLDCNSCILQNCGHLIKLSENKKESLLAELMK